MKYKEQIAQNVAQAYKRGYTFKFSSNPAEIKLYLAH